MVLGINLVGSEEIPHRISILERSVTQLLLPLSRRKGHPGWVLGYPSPTNFLDVTKGPETSESQFTLLSFVWDVYGLPGHVFILEVLSFYRGT